MTSPARATAASQSSAEVSSSALRRLPMPQSDPPFDTDLRRPQRTDRLGDATQGTLALAFQLSSGVPAAPAAPRLRLVSTPSSAPAGMPEPDEFDPQPTPRAALPAPQGWAGRFVQALVEVLAGDRPTAQLVRWTDASVYASVQRRASRATEGPPEPAPALGRIGPARAVIRSVHVSEPCDGVAEVCALVQRGARATALALRLEGIDGRWQCTALELH